MICVGEVLDNKARASIWRVVLKTLTDSFAKNDGPLVGKDRFLV